MPFLFVLSTAGVGVASVHVGDGKSHSTVLRAVSGVLAHDGGDNADGSMTKVSPLGPPGAEKRTGSQALRDVMSMPPVSTGDFQREFFLISSRLSRVLLG